LKVKTFMTSSYNITNNILTKTHEIFYASNVSFQSQT